MSGGQQPSLAQMPVTIVVAQGAAVQDGVHVLAKVAVPDLLADPAYLVFDSNTGRVALTTREGVAVHVDLATMLLQLSQSVAIATPSGSRVQ